MSYGEIPTVSSWMSRLLGTWNVDAFPCSVCPLRLSFLDLPFSRGTPDSFLSSSSVGCRYRVNPVEQRIHLASEKCGLSFWITLTIISVMTNCAPRRAYKGKNAQKAGDMLFDSLNDNLHIRNVRWSHKARRSSRLTLKLELISINRSFAFWQQVDLSESGALTIAVGHFQHLLSNRNQSYAVANW